MTVPLIALVDVILEQVIRWPLGDGQSRDVPKDFDRAAPGRCRRSREQLAENAGEIVPGQGPRAKGAVPSVGDTLSSLRWRVNAERVLALPPLE